MILKPGTYGSLPCIGGRLVAANVRAEHRGPYTPRLTLMATASDLREWIALLEQEGELVRISAEVDPDLEITEIVDRVVKSGGPALLFENPKGAPHPLLINQFGTERRMCLAFGVERLDDLADKLGEILELQPPQGLVDKVRSLGKLKSIADSMPKEVSKAACQEIVLTGDDVDLDAFPIQRCWPLDPAPFITLPAVITKDQARESATSACTGCRRSTGARPSCTGRSTRTVGPTCARPRTEGSPSPSRSGSTR